jgi:predicted heme/steroid binding protein/uncharacterized membrane protein
MREFDHETLSRFTGKDGQPAYIAHKGKVLDVSASRFWKSGMHMKRHMAGHDLTPEISAAPHGPEVLDRYPQVGTLLEKEAAKTVLPVLLERVLNRFPFLRRHPHPMLVHFPIVFMIAPVVFYFLSRITGMKSFEAAAFICLGAGVLSSVPAIITGFFTWWINYLAKPMRQVRIKILFSMVLVAVSCGTFIWRLISPDVLISTVDRMIYFFLLLCLFCIIIIISWYGATLTFPLEK